MARILVHVTHHPHPQHADDLLAAMGRLTALSKDVAGLDEIGAFLDPENGRVIAISVWKSAEALQAGMASMFTALGDIPFDEWERQPREMLTLVESQAAA